MTTKTLTRKVCSEISNTAHRAAYRAASMFLEKHDFNQGRTGNGMFIKHGYQPLDEDFVPISHLVVGEKLRNKHVLPKVSTLSISRLLRQSFVGNQVWLADDVQVPVKSFMQPVIDFVTQYQEELEVYAGIYENKLTHTNVLGIYITIKDVNQDAKRFAWEITIDDNDLVNEATVQDIFYK